LFVVILGFSSPHAYRVKLFQVEYIKLMNIV
jgi:hypothetical protein